MEQPIFITPSIAASGSAWSKDIVSLVRCRGFALGARVTCGASIDADTVVYVYFSPDGENWDSVAYTSFALTYTASATVQRTVPITVPEHGFLRFKVTNGSASDTLTNLKMWYVIQSYPE